VCSFESLYKINIFTSFMRFSQDLLDSLYSLVEFAVTEKNTYLLNSL